MTKEEFMTKKKAIVDELVSKKNTIECEAYRKQVRLEKEYAESHNTVEIGDIVSDRWDTIIVDKITLMRGGGLNSLPYLLYTGKTNQKDEKASIYQESVRSVIKKEQK
jgi:hypothetical protein